MTPPTSTYRVQLSASFGFRDAAALVPYLASLGVSHIYLSPVLESAPGSPHGYDVVDHGRLSHERGGPDGWQVLQCALREYGLGCVVDIVPNHMAIPAPESANPALWSVLCDGPKAAQAHWFDVDWAAGDGKLVLPLLGCDIDDAVTNGELVRDGERLLHHDHEFPITPETSTLPWPDVVHAQHYTLARWSDRSRPANYRRFFDVGDLIALRVEDDDVFWATHGLIVDLVQQGDIQGLRVDHPDGLADPGGYLRRLADAAPDTWIVVEKILAPGETLPKTWPCAGSTGYDTLRVVDAALTDPGGLRALDHAHHEVTGTTGDYHAIERAAKQQVLTELFAAERDRLLALAGRCLPDVSRASLGEGLDQLLVELPVYRTYLVPGEPAAPADVAVVERAATAAARVHPRLAPALEPLTDVLLGRATESSARDQLVVRFQQLAAALTAKGVEDTAGYRWQALVSRCEVGGAPWLIADHPVADLHDHAGQLPPAGMTTLSTHDTKRSEDVRARLAVLSELPKRWRQVATAWHASVNARAPVDAATGYLCWQTLVGGWPLDADRLTGYLRKARREAKQQTSWLTQDPGYEEAVTEYVRTALADAALMADVASFVAELHDAWVSNILAQKLVQLTLPGVPDVYHGAEVIHLALVDPDNRRQPDYGQLGRILARIDCADQAPGVDDDPAALKLYLTSRTLRIQHARPDLFTEYQQLSPRGAAAPHLLSYSRGGAVVVAPRLPATLAQAGGWRDTALQLPTGQWADAFTGTTHSGTVDVERLLDGFPVALLVH